MDVHVFPTFLWISIVSSRFSRISNPGFIQLAGKGVRRLSSWLGQDRLEVGGVSGESRWDRVNLKDVDEVLDVVVAPSTAFL